MALLFSRLARSFIKNGYFPTDDITLTRILSALDGVGNLRILDPCCGEGVALAEIRHHLTLLGANVTTFGVEFDEERAWHAKKLLQRVVHSDVQDVVIGARSMGLLFLNPPYGDVVSDQAQSGDKVKRERLEKIFFRKTIPTLQFGGVLVLIVPFYVIDADFSAMIARNFEKVRFFMSPETRFKQCVIFGVKKRAGHPANFVTEMLEQGGRGELLQQVLPEEWIDELYQVPAITEVECKFHAVRIDAQQLQAEIDQYAKQTLWPQLGFVFRQGVKTKRAPLRDMSEWHLALALAAGQVCGVVRSSDGRTLLIKGDTFKEKSRAVEHQIDEKGNVTEIRTLTDKFVPVIRGIDFTPGATLGQIVTIR